MSWIRAAFASVGRYLGSDAGGESILGGISSIFRRRADRRDARDASNRTRMENYESFLHDRDLANIAANQERESLLYQMQLRDWERQQRRREVGRGARNFAQFASLIPGYVNRAPLDTTSVAPPVAPRINIVGTVR